MCMTLYKCIIKCYECVHRFIMRTTFIERNSFELEWIITRINKLNLVNLTKTKIARDVSHHGNKDLFLTSIQHQRNFPVLQIAAPLRAERSERIYLWFLHEFTRRSSIKKKSVETFSWSFIQLGLLLEGEKIIITGNICMLMTRI